MPGRKYQLVRPGRRCLKAFMYNLEVIGLRNRSRKSKHYSRSIRTDLGSTEILAAGHISASHHLVSLFIGQHVAYACYTPCVALQYGYEGAPHMTVRGSVFSLNHIARVGQGYTRLQ